MYLNKFLKRQAVIFKLEEAFKRAHKYLPRAWMWRDFLGSVFSALPWESLLSKWLHTDQEAGTLPTQSRELQSEEELGCYLASAGNSYL